MKKSNVLKAALVAYAETPLNTKEERFVENVALYGMNDSQAARHAGIGRDVATRPHVIAALAEMRAANAQKMEMTRDKVLAGLSDAIERAKLMGEPLTEIAGWREVAKVAGLYDTKPAGKDLTDKQKKFLDQIQSMSDEDLALLTSKDVSLIDGRTGKVEKASSH